MPRMPRNDYVCDNTKVIAANYPELTMYEPNGTFTVTARPPKKYAIFFRVYGQTYCCRMAARSSNEAFAAFFRTHPHISYSMISGHAVLN